MQTLPEETKIRSKILKVLRNKTLMRSQLHKIIGTNVKAAYLRPLLETMRNEQLIDRQDFGHPGDIWSIWEHPTMVRARTIRAQWKKEAEEIEQYHQERQRQWEIENAPQLARERFQKKLQAFLVANEATLFNALTRIYRAHSREASWKHSRQLLDCRIRI